MKCDLCNGTGRLLKPWYDTTGLMTGFTGDVCFVCDGKGTVNEPMTNEEYIRQASAEELAKEIANHIFVSCTTNKAYRNPLYATVLHDVVEWLKEIHNDK